MDGIDAALITTDGERVLEFGPAVTVAYDERFRARLRALLGLPPDAAAAAVIAELTDRHVEAVRRLLSRAGVSAGAVDVIGFHGHTLVHRPKAGLTVQIGDGQRLADATGIAVVEDFRSADVAAGGEGAPLAPLYHAALAADLGKPLAVLNIGGVANVTWIGPDGTVVAFDTGPGNALIDDWMLAVTGRPFDAGGRLAAAGRVDTDLLARSLAHPYLRRPPPKSLDRETFAGTLDALRGLAAADGAATLTALTARTVAAAAALLPAPAKRWLVCGGGRRNASLLAMLRQALGTAVEPVEAVGWDGDALEAQAFAFLAVRSIEGLALTLPSTTGVVRPISGGVLRRPRRSG